MLTAAPYLKELTGLFERMDQAYHEAASAHGFACAGCTDNCCRTRFYHHTLLEYLYLKEGLSHAPILMRQEIAERAAEAVQCLTTAEGAPASAVLCPLNEHGRCLLYAYRPMICRLHGVPHQLQRPDGQRQIGPGCGDFDRQCDHSKQVFLDRTPLYSALADVEKRLRLRLRFDRKIKMTIAQMVIEILNTTEPVPPSGK